MLSRRRLLGPLKFSQHASILFVGLPVFLAAMLVFMNLPGDPSFAKGLTTGGRVGFAVMTFLVSYTVSLVIGFQVANFRLFVDTHVKGEN
jgi:hypothetical protein